MSGLFRNIEFPSGTGKKKQEYCPLQKKKEKKKLEFTFLSWKVCPQQNETRSQQQQKRQKMKDLWVLNKTLLNYDSLKNARGKFLKLLRTEFK